MAKTGGNCIRRGHGNELKNQKEKNIIDSVSDNKAVGGTRQKRYGNLCLCGMEY